jgi:hypothetical protein
LLSVPYQLHATTLDPAFKDAVFIGMLLLNLSATMASIGPKKQASASSSLAKEAITLSSWGLYFG